MTKTIEQRVAQNRVYMAARLTKQGLELRDLRLAVKIATDNDGLLHEMGNLKLAVTKQLDLLTRHITTPWWKKLLGRGGRP